jgi:hypothetical protein
MGNFVTVKKAKVLRFQLISVMYLLFISLSILQIPIEWLRANINMSYYIDNATSVEMDNKQILSVYNEVEKIEREFFKEAGYDIDKKIYKDPDSYSVTDMYFIRWKKAFTLFQKLIELKKYHLALPDNNPKKAEFNKLFASDLKNGLGSEKAILWVEWKFKHVPAGVVVTWLAELKLRMKLLNGGIILKEEQNVDYLVLMAYNMEAVRPGDTVRIVVFNHEEMQVRATENESVFEVDDWHGDTLYFVPKYVGVYNLSFKKNGVEETLKVTSIAKTFEREKDNKFNIFYEGKPAELHYVNLLNPSGIVCDCDPKIALNRSTNKVAFTPEKAGWCSFLINNTDGRVLLRDSIYVQKVPEPFLFAEGSSGGTMSRSRLKSDGSVSIYGTHPDLQKFKFKLTNIKYRLLGASTDQFVSEKSKIELTTEQIDKVKYIVIQGANINIGSKDFVFGKPLVIQIK